MSNFGVFVYSKNIQLQYESMAKGDNMKTISSCKNQCQPKEVPSEDEIMALNAMRSIKDRVRVLKRRLSGILSPGVDEDAAERLMLEKELAQLREEWNEWEKNRIEAARQRMILLGHEDGLSE